MKSIIANANRYTDGTNVLNEDSFGRARIVVVGCGGAGNNTITRLHMLGGVNGAQTLALNTDKQHLAITEAEKLSAEMSLSEAIYMVNKVSQDFLVRPMGIFQLIDYVGVDVVRFIMRVMNPFLENENLHSPLLDKLFNDGIKGGQNSDGSQKDGFLKYEKGRPVAVVDPENGQYIGFDNFAKINEMIGASPDEGIVWKSVVRMKNKDEVLQKFYTDMKALKSLGAKLAMDYGRRSNAIGKALVNDKVAHNEEDVNTVLLTGFFHAYGPINNYFD